MFIIIQGFVLFQLAIHERIKYLGDTNTDQATKVSYAKAG